MEEKDIFGLDDRDLRLPRQYSRPRQVASSMLIDDSARYLGDAVIKGVTSFDKRMASIQASKDALTTFVTGLQEQATSLDNLDDNNVSDQIQRLLNEQIDEINLLGYNSIGRDQTEFIKRKSQLVSSTKNLLENMLNKDEQAADYQKIINSGQAANKISQLTPTINQEYLQDILLNNGRGSKVEYKNGAFIVTFTGKDGKTLTYNASNDINATKKGAAPFIKLVDDFDPSYKTSYDRIAAKYQPTLTSITEFVGEGKNRRKIITKEKEYNTIRELILEELTNDPNFAANVSLDETQYLRGKGVDGIEEVYDITLGDEKSLLELNDKIKEQRANYILNQYLPADAVISRETIDSPVDLKASGKDDDKEDKVVVDNSAFIKSLNDITDVQETGSVDAGTLKVGGIPPVSQMKPEDKGKIYQNVNKNSPNFGKRYIWDGKKYVEAGKKISSSTIRKRKIEEIYKYLLRKNTKLLKNDDTDVMIAYPNTDPKDRTVLYIPLQLGEALEKGQGELNYGIIDLDSKFDDNILNNEEALNKALNEIILRTVGGVTSAAAFNK